MSEPGAPLTLDTDAIVAVVDTNVLLDVYSCHDVTAAYDKWHAKLGDAAIQHPEVAYRIARAREGTLLAIYLHRIRATTFSLHHEPLALVTEKAPPAPGGLRLEADFVRTFVHFTHEFVLPNWTTAMPTEPGSERGNQADDALLKVAKDRDLPMITNEGNSRGGLVDSKLRKRAQDSGVRVYTPGEFYEGKMVEHLEANDFLARYQEQVPIYLSRRHAELGKDDKTGELLDWVLGFYRMVLRGVVGAAGPP